MFQYYGKMFCISSHACPTGYPLAPGNSQNCSNCRLPSYTKRGMYPVTDLGEGPGDPAPPLYWIKKEEMTEGKMASRASKSRTPPPPLNARSGSATGILYLH